MFIFAIEEKENIESLLEQPVEASLVEKSSTCIVKAKKTARKCPSLVVCRSACMSYIPLPCLTTVSL
jgi:hypothetical protein